jgi:hypothetical protein
MVAAQDIRLKYLLEQRHWQTYRTFCLEYDKAARVIDRSLVGTYPSRAQFHRWLAGALKGLPFPEHCRVLEALLPGWSARQLFEPCPSKELALTLTGSADAGNPGDTEANSSASTERVTGRFSDLAEVFTSRSEFMSRLPPHTLFGDAQHIQAAGLSLNLLCQQYPDQRLRQLLEGGTTLRCLFLDPGGTAIRAREEEEGHPSGHLSALTECNIQVLLQRIRNRLSTGARERLEVAVYDDTIRFNIVLIDGDTCVFQPYLPEARGVDSPTFVARRQWPDAGLVPVFEQMFTSLWERSRKL